MDSEPRHLIQSTALPPAQPAYVLRGHQAQIHAVHFLRDNLRLLSGDADGWVVLWNLPIKRPVAVWRAHSNAILGISSWKADKIITYSIHRCCPCKVAKADKVVDMAEITNFKYGN